MATASAVGKEAIHTHGTVRVSLPAQIAYNPDALKKTIGSLVARLGCQACFSGADCFFTFERNFVVDPQGALTHSISTELNPQPLPPGRTRHSSATVSLASGVRGDINKVFRAVDAVILNLGPCPCHSGFDIAYLNEMEKVIHVNEQLEAKVFGV